MTAPARPAPTAKAPDPRRTLLGLKGVALGVTALATAGVTGLVLVAQTDATAGQTAEEVVVESPVRSGPVVTAQDPFFDRGSASSSNSVRRSRRIILRSRGS